jgi:hypothetical protein
MIEKWTKIIYLAGPYRAETEYLVSKNIAAAREIAVELWGSGFVVICPHLNTAMFGGALGLPDDVWLVGDLVIVRRCDLLVVLPGWRFSNGTKKEIEVAREIGIPVYYWENPDDQLFLRHFYDLLDKKGH